MKLFKILLAVILTHTLMSTSCSKDDATITNTAAGNWVITTYWDKKDETAKFTGYTFDFHNGGHAQATKAGVIVDGSWSESGSKFTINFGTDPILSKLNKSWLKEAVTATSMKIKDDNPSSDEWVLFTK
jgi:hypothetical protein